MDTIERSWDGLSPNVDQRSKKSLLPGTRFNRSLLPILIGLSIFIDGSARGQQATTDWTPFSDNSLPELRPNVLPPNIPLRKPDEPSLVILPSLEVDESFTDNALGTSSNRRADFYTTVSPDLFVSDQSARLQGFLNLNPQVIYYAENSSQNQTIVNAQTNGTAVVIPERLFFDAQGSAGEVARSGLQGFGNQVQIPANDRVQQYSYSASPYAFIPFGRSTSAEVRYRISQVLFNGNTGATISPLTGLPLAPISNSTEHEGFAKLKTTALSDRALLSLTGDYVDFLAPGTEFSSQNLTIAAGASYLIGHALWATGSFGFERLIFPDIQRLNFTGPTWEVGGRYAPSDTRLAALSFGSYEGRLGFRGDLKYAITPIVSVFATYSQQIQTPQQAVIQNLPLQAQSTPGTTLNELTGLPLNISNPNFGLQNGIFYTKSLQAGASYALGRNNVALTFNYENDQELAGASPSQSSVGGEIILSHEMSPKTVASGVAGYSTVSEAAFGGLPSSTGRVATVGLGLTYSITPTFQASANYAFQYTSGNLVTPIFVDLVTLGLRKTF